MLSEFVEVNLLGLRMRGVRLTDVQCCFPNTPTPGQVQDSHPSPVSPPTLTNPLGCSDRAAGVV